MNFYRKVVLLPWNFLSLRNSASHFTLWTSKEILALQNLCCCFEFFFLLEIFLRTLDMVVFRGVLFRVNFFKKVFSWFKNVLSFTWMFCIYLILCILSFKYFLKSFGEFFTFKFPSNTGKNFCTFWLSMLPLM